MRRRMERQQLFESTTADPAGIPERFADALRRYGRDVGLKGLSRRLAMTPAGVRKLLDGDCAPSAYTLREAVRAWGPQVLLETLLTPEELTQHARHAQAWAAVHALMSVPQPAPTAPAAQQQVAA